jgi:hypothetical protein
LVAGGAIHSGSGNLEVVADYLRSVVEHYVKENPSTSTKPASGVIIAAYSLDAYPQPRKK